MPREQLVLALIMIFLGVGKEWVQWSNGARLLLISIDLKDLLLIVFILAIAQIKIQEDFELPLDQLKMKIAKTN